MKKTWDLVACNPKKKAWEQNGFVLTGGQRYWKRKGDYTNRLAKAVMATDPRKTKNVRSSG